MNPHVLAYLCFFAVVGGIVAAFMGSLSWGQVGLIFVGTFVACIINGLIIGAGMRNNDQ